MNKRTFIHYLRSIMADLRLNHFHWRVSFTNQSQNRVPINVATLSKYGTEQEVGMNVTETGIYGHYLFSFSEYSYLFIMYLYIIFKQHNCITYILFDTSYFDIILLTIQHIYVFVNKSVVYLLIFYHDLFGKPQKVKGK